MEHSETALQENTNRKNSSDNGFLRCLGLLLIFLALATNIILVNQDGVNIHYFLDAIVFMAMGIPICAVVLVTGEADFIGKAIKSIFSKKVELSKEEAKNAVNLFLLLRKTTVLSAIVPMTIDLIRVYADPAITAYPVSFMLVPVLYASFIVMALINPALYVFKKRSE